MLLYFDMLSGSALVVLSNLKVPLSPGEVAEVALLTGLYESWRDLVEGIQSIYILHVVGLIADMVWLVLFPRSFCAAALHSQPCSCWAHS